MIGAAPSVRQTPGVGTGAIRHQGRCDVAVIKTIDLVGVSSESWRDAANQALSEASKTIRGITGMDVLDTSCNVSDGQIAEYLTHVRIRFRIER
jgi:flavin-binding protein dodecin